MFDKDEKLRYQFLPSMLEIIETPPSILSRTILWLMVIVILTILGWSFFGKIDEVVQSRGKIIPGDGVIKIQAPIQGQIAKILIKEGENVVKNQVLFEYDKSAIDLEIKQTQEKIKILEAEKLVFGGHKTLADFSLPGDLQNNFYNVFNATSETISHQTSINTFKIKQLEVQLDVETKNASRLSQTLQSLHEQEKILQAGIASGAINNVQDLTTELFMLQRQSQQHQNSLDSQNAKITQLKQQIDEISANSSLIWSSHRQTSATKLVELEKRLIELKASLSKLDLSQQQLTVRATKDGTVTLLGIDETAVVASGQILATIVPDEAQFMIETMVLDRDIGVISLDDEVSVKIDAYNYQKYGLLSGKVKNISSDSVVDEKLGLVYKVKILIDGSKTNIGKDLKIISGMGTSVEIKTGNKRIMDFFIEPLLKRVDDGFKVK